MDTYVKPPHLKNKVRPWVRQDYVTMATFMLYGRRKIKLYRRHWDMIDKLSTTLMELENMRSSKEERLTFHIGNRWCQVGDWMEKVE